MIQKKFLAIGVVFSVCLFHIVAVMGYLGREGRLSMVPIYDDVTYLVDGLNRLSVIDRAGIGGLLSDLQAHPAHAPFMAVTGAFGFLLSGGATWGPYLVNSLWIFFVLWLAMMVLRDISLKSSVGIVVAVLAAPLFGIAIAEFRPDPVWGLLVGFSVALLVSVDLSHANRYKLLMLGILLGGAILAKPTAAPASVVVILAAYFGRIGSSFLFKNNLDKRRFLVGSLAVAGAALFTVTPYAIASGSDIFDYVMMVMSSGNSVWRTDASMMGHATYYLNRSFGLMTLGWIWYCAPPIAFLSLCLIVRAKDRDAFGAFIGLACAFITAYAIVTVSSVKSPMIGSILYGTIIGLVVWCAGQIVRHVRIRHELVLLIGLAIFLMQWVPAVGMVKRTTSAMQTTDQATRAALPILLKAFDNQAKTSVVVTVPGPVYAGTLDFLARQNGRVGNFYEGYVWDTWELFVKGIDGCNVVVVSEPGMRGQALGYNFPSVRFQPRVIEYLRKENKFEEHRVFTDEAGRSVMVFVRKQ